MTISSVVVYVEHYEESGFKGGNLQWSVGSGWSTSPDVWDTITAPIHTQESNEALYSWDVTNVVTASNINAMELLVKNNDNNKKTLVDHIYAEVTWSTGPPPDPNTAPILTVPTLPTNIAEDAPFGFIATATDAEDLPTALTFSLDNGVGGSIPTGASIT